MTLEKIIKLQELTERRIKRDFWLESLSFIDSNKSKIVKTKHRITGKTCQFIIIDDAKGNEDEN